MTIDRSKIPLHGKPVDLILEEPAKETLDNGMDVYLIHAGNEEVIRLDIVVDAGSVYQQKKLTASSVGKLLKEGQENTAHPKLPGLSIFVVLIWMWR